MRKIHVHIITTAALVLFAQPKSYGEETLQPTEPLEASNMASTPAVAQHPFERFTGKILKNKVRLRTQPNLESPIIKELAKGDMLIVEGESDSFYAVTPPAGIKAYVFRTFVLDNVVEGSRVNIRSEPDLEAPIIGQLNSGDRIQSTVCAQNNKWLEIVLPTSSHFYLAKEYVEKIGDADMLAKMEKRHGEVTQLLNSASQLGRKELEKTFDEINLDIALASLNKVIAQYSDFPELVNNAKELQKTFQDTYLEKKVRFLETRTKLAADKWTEKNQQLANEMKLQQEKIKEMEDKLQLVEVAKVAAEENLHITEVGSSIPSEPITAKMSLWNPVEAALYQAWLEQNPDKSMSEFYLEEEPIVLKGIIEPYNRTVKNKPGDYVLINRGSNLPIAFMYSTKVNLQERAGQEHVVIALPRDNHNFAYPAYFVLSVE